MIKLSIDLTKVDKAKIKELTRKNGDKAKFLDLVLIEVTSDYGDYMVKQDSSKEERENKVQTPILGNAKIIGNKPTVGKTAQKPVRVDNTVDNDGDDIPF